MACVDAPSLRASVGALTTPGFLHDPAASVRYTDLAHGTSFGGRLAELAGRSVLLATGGQLTSALALIELDGVARRIVILPPDVDRAHLPAIAAAAGVDAIVTDAESGIGAMLDVAVRVNVEPRIATAQPHVLPALATEWVMLTSGTTGVPKLVVHSFAGLAAAIRARSPADGAAVWATFYDIRRYGGLQMLSACGARRRFAGALERERTRRRPSGPAQGARCQSSRRHAVALAARADARPRSTRSRRAMCGCPARSPTRRSSMRCGRRSRTRRSGMLMRRPRPASPSTSTTGARAFRRVTSAPCATASK